MRKLLLTLFFLILGANAFAGWDATKPADNEYKYLVPIDIRNNWDAIALGTDSALLITNAKVSASAGIVDSKLAQITTASKVSGAALTLLGSVPAGSTALPITSGGTGQTTRQAALDAMAISTGGASGQALITNATNASWGYPSSLTVSSATTGDLLYYNGSAWVRLADSTSGLPLIAGGVGAAPAYGSIGIGTTANINGTLGIANGGTGQTTAQAAIDALTAVSGATNEYVLTKNTADGHALFKAIPPSGLSKISTTTISSGYSSGTISITSNHRYKVMYRFNNSQFVYTRKLGLRFNSNASYSVDMSTGAGLINLSGNVQHENFSGSFELIPVHLGVLGANPSFYLKGSSINTANGTVHEYNFSGYYTNGTTAPASFEIYGPESLGSEYDFGDGLVVVYEYI